jgi:hypothetical protein
MKIAGFCVAQHHVRAKISLPFHKKKKIRPTYDSIIIECKANLLGIILLLYEFYISRPLIF